MNAATWVMVAALSVALSKVDPIDAWVMRLDADPMWQNGASPILELPQKATIPEVLAKVFQMTSCLSHDKAYKILEIREVHISGGCLPDLYTAVLAQTTRGKVVILLQYHGVWWSRVLDVP